MASLTRDQIEILRWIVESGEDKIVLAEGPGWATVVASGANLEVSAGDVRELEPQGLLRLVRGHLYEVTNDVRAAYEYPRTRRPNLRRSGSARK